MGTCDLLDMYTLLPSLRPEGKKGVHIKQITSAHVTAIKCSSCHLESHTEALAVTGTLVVTLLSTECVPPQSVCWYEHDGVIWDGCPYVLACEAC